MSRTELEVDESTTGIVTGTLKKLDASGVLVALPLADVTSIECTLINELTGDIINSRQKQNVLNANNCTLHATSGLFTWSFRAADTAIVGATDVSDLELHLATFTVIYDTTEQYQFEVLLKVLNLRSVPQVGA